MIKKIAKGIALFIGWGFIIGISTIIGLALLIVIGEIIKKVAGV